jgi:mutator protein MutT
MRSASRGFEQDIHNVSKPFFEVAVALVCREDRWLVARRPTDVHLGGLWEFPGGKRARDESAERAALRELHEECGVEAVAERTLDALRCDYGDRVVRITPVICRWQSGEARPLASDECRWISAAELGDLDMPEINAEIIRTIRAGA